MIDTPIIDFPLKIYWNAFIKLLAIIWKIN